MTKHGLPGDHYILGKLEVELLPWIIGGKQAKRQWFVHTARFHSYTSDLAAALSGLGVGTPIAALIIGELPGGKTAITVLRETFPDWLFYAGVIGLLLWIGLKVVIKNEEVIARALLARELSRGMNSYYAQLLQALARTDPMPQIIALQKTVDEKVQEAIVSRIWPYDPPVPGESDVDAELAIIIASCRRNFMSKWPPPPPGVR